MIDERNKMFVGKEINRSNASKLLSKIKTLGSLVKIMILGFENMKILIKREKTEKIYGKLL